MSKQEESKFDKLKHFLGIGSHRGNQGVALSGGLRPTPREFIFTDELLKEIGPQTPTQHRLKNVRELSELVCIKRLEPNAVEAIWLVVKDLLTPPASTEERHVVLIFLTNLIKGQYEQLGVMRAYFFRVLQGHTLFEDLSPRLDLLQALTSDGKDLEYVEDEIGSFLLESMKAVMSSDRIPDYLRLLINVLKFNVAYLDEEIVAGLVINTCLIATKTKKDEEVQVSLKLLDTVICYSYLPLPALNHLIFCLCQILNIEKFAQDTWQLMRKLLGTHVGHNAVHSMCCILQDSGTTASDSSALLLRGAVFFISMALWGSKRVMTLKYPPNAVLPAFQQSLIQSGAPVLANEIALSIQRLITKYGNEQPIVTWDLILDVIQKLLLLVEKDPSINPVMVQNIHDLLTAIESLHERKQFHGSTEQFFSIIEMCASQRPESSILMLVCHKVQHIYPSVKDNWILKLNYLMDKYFTKESRTKIQLKVLDLVQQVITRNKYLYEEDLIELVVVPHLSNIHITSNISVKTKAVELILDLIESSQSACVQQLIEILSKVINQPCWMTAPSSHSPTHVNTESATRERPKSLTISDEDIMPAVDGLLKLYKMKLFETPSEVAVRVYDLLVEHLQSHYTQSPLLLHAGTIRYKLFEVFLTLRADTNQRLGLYDNHKNGIVIYTSFLACAGSKEPEDVDNTELIMSYSKVFRCIRICLEKELNWNVLKLVLDHLPSVLQNKTLLLAADWADVDRFCACLQAMVGDRSQGLPDKLLHVPPRLTRSDFHSYVFPVLTCLVAYHDMLDKYKQRDLVKCLEFGLVSKCARICVRALTVCALEMVDIMMRLLPSVLLKLSQISATVAMAIPLMEFLSSLIHCPQLYGNFVEDQYMSVFAIALPYTNPFKYSHYTVSLAYNVVGLWFIKCRLPFRKGFVGFIIKGLRSNVLRQIEETSQRSQMLNQDSSERIRTQSLNDGALRSEEINKDSRSRAVAANARARTTQPAIAPAQLDEKMSLFHKELMETCVDMLARYTYSTRSNIPKRSPVAEFLLKGGQSQSWLLGNRIITVTTSGGSKVGRAGLCEKCLLAARVASSKMDKQPNTTPTSETSGGGRRRHKSAAVKTQTESISLKPLSKDDILLHNRNEATPGDMLMRDERSNSFVLPETDDMPVVSISREQVPLHTHTEKMQAMDNVLMSIRAKPSDNSIFSPHLCNCWCTQWAEIHIRRPTGTFSWIMRIQNEDNMIDSFPDFPLADVSSLFMSERAEQELVNLSRTKIDGTTIPEKDYEHLWEEHFYGKPGRHKPRPSVCMDPQLLDEEVFVDEVDAEESHMRKIRSMPEFNQDNSGKVMSESEKKHTIEDLTASPIHIPSKDPPKSVTLDIKVTKQAESKSSEAGQISPPVKYDSPKRDSRSNRGSSSTTSFVSIPEDSVAMESPSSVNSVRSSLYSGVFGKEGPVQGGMNPSFLFLQLYHANFFDTGNDRPLLLPSNESVQRSLKMLDMIYPFQTHKIGVLYVGKGQVNNEVAILSNQFGSERYMQFIEGLGQIIRLKDCTQEMTYMGGLDAKGNDGQFAYVWQDEIIQLVYHVATLMPNKESDTNHTKKKLHIGNDYVTVVYNDSNEDYKIGTIKGQFNYVNIIINPLDHNTNAVTVRTRDDIEELIGHTDTKIISDGYLSSLVRQMALHADVASIIMQKQKSNPKDPFASNWLERLRQINRIRAKVTQETSGQPGNQGNKDSQSATGGLTNVDDFTNYVS